MLYIGVDNEMSGLDRYIQLPTFDTWSDRYIQLSCKVTDLILFIFQDIQTRHPNLAYYISLQINSFLIVTSSWLFLFHDVPDLVCCLSAAHVSVSVRYWVAVALPISWQTIELPHQQKWWSQLDGKCGTCHAGAISHRSLWSLPLSHAALFALPLSYFLTLFLSFFLSLCQPVNQLLLSNNRAYQITEHTLLALQNCRL